MHLQLIAITLIGAFFNVIATPYFRAPLRSRQVATPGVVHPNIYPSGFDQNSCPVTGNLWASLQRLDRPASKTPTRRSLHSDLTRSGRLRMPRQANTTTCQQVGEIDVSGYQGGNGDTPTITLPGGYQYFLSLAANVWLQSVTTWTSPVDGGNFKNMDTTYFDTEHGQYNGTMNFTLAKTTNFHWQVYFVFGAPSVKFLLFSNEGPGAPLLPTSKR